MSPKVMRVGTHFSGMAMPLHALRHIQRRFIPGLCCDTDELCRDLIKHVWNPDIVYTDVANIHYRDAPVCDYFHFSPPCQPFSSEGKGECDDVHQGRLWTYSMQYILLKKPNLVTYEIVANIVCGRHREEFTKMIKNVQESRI